eukprot:9421623-Heterocapsa_arctica.AAC.1
MEDITKQEELISQMKADIKNKRSTLWRHWVDNSWEHKKHIHLRMDQRKAGKWPAYCHSRWKGAD